MNPILMNAKRTKKVKNSVYSILKQHKINDSIMIRIKKLSNPKWLGQYRSLTQFSRMPIIWLQENIKPIAKEYNMDIEHIDRDTVLHEYGHIIWEFAKYNFKELSDLLTKEYGDDEEAFHEIYHGYI